MQFLGFRVLIKRIKAIRFMMADKSVPKWKKAIIIAGIVYLFLPIDIIPPIIFPFGIIDDIIIWLLILWYLSSELDKYWLGEKPTDLSKKYRKKDIVDNVEFNVDEDEGDARAAGRGTQKDSGADPEAADAGAADKDDTVKNDAADTDAAGPSKEEK